MTRAADGLTSLLTGHRGDEMIEFYGGMVDNCSWFSSSDASVSSHRAGT